MFLRALIALCLFSAPLSGQHTFLDSDKKVQQRQRWFLEQRAYPYDSLPVDHIRSAVAAEIARHGKLARTRNLQTYSWESVGPANYGGRMTSVAVQPGNANVWIAGSAAAGVWRTGNRGQTWYRLPTQNFPTYAVGAVAFHPQNPAELYAGTGEPNFASFTFPGDGVMRSTNGGETWSPCGTTTMKGTIADLVVHPDRPALLFAANAGFGETPGVYRSEDRGTTWNLVLSGTSAMDIAVHPVRRNLLYAVLSYPLGNSANGVYRSLDTGRTWTRLSGGLPAQPGRMALAVTPAAPDRLYVLVSRTNGQLDGLYVSADTGTSFVSVPSVPADLLGYQGWYNIAVAVSPTSVADLTIGGVKLYRSTTAGASWTELNVHVDQHALHYLSSDSVLIANDGGMYTARNFQTAARNTGLTTTQYYDISVPAPGRIFGGTQDNGSHMWIGGTWSTTELGGDVMQTIAHNSVGGLLFAAAPYGLIFKSTTDGSTWFSSANGIDYSRPAAWKAPLRLSRVSGQSSTLFTATTRVYRSTDLATTWTEISPDLSSPFTPVTALAQAQTDAYLIVAATQDGKVFYTRTGGTSWSDISFGLPERFPTSVAVHPTDKRTFVVTFSGYGSGHVWRSTNQGSTWMNVSATLPDLPVNCFLFDPVLPDTKWYIGTDFGVYYTLNAGQNWLPLTTDIGIAPVTDLEIVESTRDLVAATFGMGIFRAKIDLLPVEFTGMQAVRRGRDVLLTWETASERNNALFLVERSTDNRQFDGIGRIAGYGTSAVPRSYAYTDRDAVHTGERLYYRLVQVDFDGTETVLPSVEVDLRPVLFLEETAASIAPNPFGSTTEVHYRLARTSRVSMDIFSSIGSHVRRMMEDAHHNSGSFAVVWDGRNDAGADMPPGVYLLRLVVNGHSTTIPVLKQ